MIILPAYLSAPSALATISVCQEIMEANGVAEINAMHLKYVDPFGMAMLGACFDAASRQGCAIRVHQLSKNLNGYLQRMDVFKGVELVNGPPNNGMRRDRSDALVELTRLSNRSEVGKVSLQLAQAMIGRADPEVSPQSCSAG